ncbi:hypothetical protein DERP_000016 [Dermatophagoides pteronyssinus]|uniref:Uncharacterized protein n=1 Tax=Dermatophagoides pteronyssinus TaxID=6956 RepID=A0ABQ8IYZ6_DERPT|nr:hypothetical protein DERP_000016 [Dermatophagoides pteronyssinus]
MCDGDDEIRQQGLLFDQTVFVNSKGQIRNETKINMNEITDNHWFELKNVYNCMGGLSITEILPLIGHDRDNLYRFMENNDRIILPRSKSNNMTDIDDNFEDELKKMSRPPGAYLVSDGDQLYGVTIVNDQNENIKFGPVTMIVPNKNGQNVIVIKSGIKNDEHNNIMLQNFQLQTTEEMNLDQIILNEQNENVNIGIVSIDGFLLITQTHFNSTEFVLLLNGGYIVTYNAQIEWIRANIDQTIIMDVNQEQIANVKCTKIGQNEVFVCFNGALVYDDENHDHFDHGDNSNNDNQNQTTIMKLIGTNNAIVDYYAFKKCILSLSGQHRTSAS